MAVGDAAFQKKCLGKMGDVAKTGRTILFVSHNMAAMRVLTLRCLYLHDGGLRTFGQTGSVIDKYLSDALEQRRTDSTNLDFYRRTSAHAAPVHITGLWVDKHLHALPELEAGKPFTVCIAVEADQPTNGANVTLILKNHLAERVTVLFSSDSAFTLNLPPGPHLVTVQVESLTLTPGQYWIEAGINQSTHTVAYDVVVDVPLFHISNHPRVTQWADRPWGVVHCDHVQWKLLQ